MIFHITNIFNQINAAFRDFFQKHLNNLTNPKCLNGSVNIWIYWWKLKINHKDSQFQGCDNIC